MSDNYFTRSFDLIPTTKLSSPILIFGVGSIGSYTALALAKAGFSNLTLLDHDTVDYENIGPQFYSPDQIEQSKTMALADNLDKFIGADDSQESPFFALTQKFTYDYTTDFLELSKLVTPETVVICAIDSMKARTHLFHLLKELPYKGYIDSRMAIESLDLYAFNRTNVKTQGHYAKTLFTDESAIQAPCTNKAISYTSLIAGGVIAKLVKDIILDKLTTYSVKMDITSMSTDILEIKE